MKIRHFIFLFLLGPLSLFAENIDWPVLFNDTVVSKKYSEVDRAVIKEALTDFKAAQHDTSRYNAVYSLVENLMSDDWIVYNSWLLEKMEKQHNRKDLREDEMKLYAKLYASTLGNNGLQLGDHGNFEEAIEYFNRALELHKRNNDQENIATVFNNIGYIYSKKGDALMALEFYESSLHIREELNDKEGIALSLNNIGFIYERIGDIVKAIDNYEKALKMREEVNDVAGIANSFHNLAAIHLEQGDKEKASEYYDRALSIREEIGDMQGLALTLNNVGFMLKEEGKVEEAKVNYQRSYDIYEEVGDRPGQVLALHNMAAICVDEEDWTCARKYLEQAWTMNEGIGDEYSAASLLQLMANMELKEGNIVEAEEKALEAIEIASKNHYARVILNTALVLDNIYKETRNWKKRYYYHDLYLRVSDSLNNNETQKAAIAQSLKYEYEKAELERIKEQEKKDVIAEKEMLLQRIISLGIGLFLILAIVIATLIWNRLKVTRKQKAVIEKQNREIQDSIYYARRIQMAILPPLSLVEGKLDSFVYFRPKDVVAGDFYYYVEKLPHIYFAVADCTGHGVPGAMVSVVCNNALNRAVNEYEIEEPADILDKVRELVLETFAQSDEDVKDGMDIAFCKYNIESKRLIFAGAQNPLYHITTMSGEVGEKTIHNGTHRVVEYKGDKQPIGKYARQNPFSQHEIQLETGDSVFISSDGYADQFGGPKGRKLMYKPFKKLLLDIHQKDVSTQKQLLDEHFESWKGAMDQIDDVCIVGVKI